MARIFVILILLIGWYFPCNPSWILKHTQIKSIFALQARHAMTKTNEKREKYVIAASNGRNDLSSSSPSLDNPFELERLFGDVFHGEEHLDLTPFEDLTEEEQQIYIDKLLNEKEAKRLGENLQNMLAEQWDIENGVYTVPPKPKPLKINVDLMVYHGKKAFLSGDYELALKTYTQAVEYDPCDGRGWQGLGIIYYKQRQYAMAEKAYLDGLYYDANNPYLLQGYSNMIVKLGRVENARKLLLQSVKHHPTHAASWLLLGELDERKGDISGARNCYTRAVEGQPDNFVAVHALGTMELRQRNYDIARQLFQRAYVLSPRSVHSLHALAKLESTTGNYSKALEYYEAAIERFPTFTYCYNGKVEIYELLHRFEDARREFERGAPYAKQAGDAGFFQSWACFGHRQLEHHLRRAERTFRSLPHLEHFFPSSFHGYRFIHMTMPKLIDDALPDQLNRNTSNSHLLWGNISSLSIQGRRNETLEEEERFLHVLSQHDGSKGIAFVLNRLLQQHNQSLYQNTLTPSSPKQSNATLLLSEKEIIALQATLQFLSLKMREIRRNFRIATRLNKYHSHTWVAWAHFERKLGSSEMARKLLVAGIANFPHSKNIGRFHTALGALASDQGDLLAARACFERALKTTPPQHSLPVYLEFIRAELEVGPSRQATKLVEKALKLFPNDQRLRRYAQDYSTASI